MDGEFTGRVKGVPSFREGKVPAWNPGWPSTAWAGSPSARPGSTRDSLNDLPLLSKVTHPVAVDPDETLKEIALEQDWMIISLRYCSQRIPRQRHGPDNGSSASGVLTSGCSGGCILPASP